MATFYLLLMVVTVVSGSQLTPFIAWSTDKSIDFKIDSQNVNQLASALGSTSASTVVVFAFDKLSFDDIAKYGGIYNDATSELESAMESASFQYWNGLNSVSKEWVSELSAKLSRNPTYIELTHLNRINNPNGGLYIIRLTSEDGFKKNDAVVGQVMNIIKSNKDLSYLAIYTKLPQPQKNGRTVRSVNKRDTSSVTASSTTTNTYCPIGGQLRDSVNNTQSGSTCMLFCLSDLITFVPSVNNGTNITCQLRTPYTISYNCSGSNATGDDVISDEYGRAYPSVRVTYIVHKNASNDMSSCSAEFWSEDNFVQPDNANDKQEFEVELTFFFPKDFLYNDTQVPANHWAIMISSITTQRWVPPEDDLPQQPPDDKDNEQVSKRVLLIRKSYSQLQPQFLVSDSNSYACSAALYSSYATAIYNVSNGTLQIKGFDSNSTSSQFLNLSSIQVQPYNVDVFGSFAAADNCIGYFTEVGWMGIISMAILIIILYLAILCAFSIRTLDQFEDPRGQTISVEKLH